MIISELIRRLESVKAEHGDLDVCITESGTNDEVVDVAGISTMMDSDDEAVHALICDEGMLDALSE